MILDSSGFRSHCTRIRGHITIHSIKTETSFHNVEGKTAESTAATADSAVASVDSTVVHANSAVLTAAVPLQDIAKSAPYHVQSALTTCFLF